MTALRKAAPDVTDTARIVDRINRLTDDDLDGLGAWQTLADLSSRTQFEGIDCDPDSVVVDSEGNFEALASVYITLVYGPSRDEESLSDEYLATINGILTVDDVEISAASVDTSSFYE